MHPPHPFNKYWPQPCARPQTYSQRVLSITKSPAGPSRQASSSPGPAVSQHHCSLWCWGLAGKCLAGCPSGSPQSLPLFQAWLRCSLLQKASSFPQLEGSLHSAHKQISVPDVGFCWVGMLVGRRWGPTGRSRWALGKPIPVVWAWISLGPLKTTKGRLYLFLSYKQRLQGWSPGPCTGLFIHVFPGLEQ